MRRLMLALVGLVIVAAALPSRPAEAQQTERCFAETSQCISGRFREFWEQNGGLAVFGFPITAATGEPNRDTGRTYLTQWFERNRFELHSELAAPYDVLLGRLGDDRLGQLGVDWQTRPRDAGPQSGCLWFEQTGRNVCDQAATAGFKTYWQSNGLRDPQLNTYGRSLALLGLPLTEARMETNSSGDTVLTQWFERARFEWHPNKPAPFMVLLGLLGVEVRRGGGDGGTLPNLVASGDTTATSTVLWARSTALGSITFDVATDAAFGSIVRTETAGVADARVPVKVTITGLSPGTEYHYRVRDAAASIALGRFRTAAVPGTRAGLRFGVSGDWRGELAPYPSISNADERNLQLFVANGDTVYADYASPAVPARQASTLDEFRRKHDEVYSTRDGMNSLGALRASTSILATIDDHEVTNDFAGGADVASDPRFGGAPGTPLNDSALFETGVQVFHEYNPIASESYGETGDARTANERKLYRYRAYGGDAAVFVLDTRSFRDQGLPPVADPRNPAQILAFLNASFNPTRTMLGKQQLADLKQDLRRAQDAGITWKFIVVPEPIQNLGVAAASDRFEGYAAERTELLQYITTSQIDHVVFIAADIHGTLVNNLTYQTAPGAPQIATGAWEITTGAVAFDAPFGPTVINLASSLNLLTPQQRAVYDAANRQGKDAFIRQLVDALIAPLGYNAVGLEGSGIDATLVQGSYVAVHSYGWTEFEIDKDTQALRVITYGIDPYTEAERAANPSTITSRTPFVVSEFIVRK